METEARHLYMCSQRQSRLGECLKSAARLCFLRASGRLQGSSAGWKRHASDHAVEREHAAICAAKHAESVITPLLHRRDRHARQRPEISLSPKPTFHLPSPSSSRLYSSFLSASSPFQLSPFSNATLSPSSLSPFSTHLASNHLPNSSSPSGSSLISNLSTCA